MANRQKSNFSDKLKRLGCNQLQKQSKFKSKQLVQQSLASIIREKDQQMQQKISVQMLDEMRKQIDSLQYKLIQAQRDREKKDVQIQMLSLKIGQKNIQSTYLSQELVQSHRSIEMIKKKLEMAQSELENMRLRHKMESISTEISKQKPLSSPLKHQKHRKGKFSQAILPAAFGSQKKFEFHNSQLLVKDEVVEEDINPNQIFLRSPFSGYLIEEWQRTQNERNCKQLQVASLQSKITSLKKEIAKQQKQIEVLKAQRHSGQQLAAALQEIRQQNRRYKLVLMKLRESEKKRKELSNILKLKGQTVEQDKFFGFSTIADINEMIQKTAQNLEIEHNVIEIVVQQYKKEQKYVQATYQAEQKQGNEYLGIIEQLKHNMKKNEEQFRLVCQQIKIHYEQQIRQYAEDVQHYQAKLQHYIKIANKYEHQKQLTQDSHCSVSSECQIISLKQFLQKTAIASQIQQLTTLNQEYKQKIKALDNQNKQMLSQIEHLSKKTEMIDKKVQVDQGLLNINAVQESQCPLCLQSNLKYSHLKQQLGRLNKIIQVITQQRDHFKHYYEESLTTYHQLELETDKQLNKLKAECQQKQGSIRSMAAELLQKLQQAEHFKLELNQLQLRLHQQQKFRNKLQEKVST